MKYKGMHVVLGLGYWMGPKDNRLFAAKNRFKIGDRIILGMHECVITGKGEDKPDYFTFDISYSWSPQEQVNFLKYQASEIEQKKKNKLLKFWTE